MALLDTNVFLDLQGRGGSKRRLSAQRIIAQLLAQNETLVTSRINVAELYRLSGLMDGAEMYSRIQETDDPEAYIDLANRRAEHIRASTTHKMLRLL